MSWQRHLSILDFTPTREQSEWAKTGLAIHFPRSSSPEAALHASLTSLPLFGSKATLNSDINMYVNLLLIFN